MTDKFGRCDPDISMSLRDPRLEKWTVVRRRESALYARGDCGDRIHRLSQPLEFVGIQILIQERQGFARKSAWTDNEPAVSYARSFHPSDRSHIALTCDEW